MYTVVGVHSESASFERVKAATVGDIYSLISPGDTAT